MSDIPFYSFAYNNKDVLFTKWYRYILWTATNNAIVELRTDEFYHRHRQRYEDPCWTELINEIGQLVITIKNNTAVNGAHRLLTLPVSRSVAITHGRSGSRAGQTDAWTDTRARSLPSFALHGVWRMCVTVVVCWSIHAAAAAATVAAVASLVHPPSFTSTLPSVA